MKLLIWSRACKIILLKRKENSERVPDWNYIIPDKNMTFFIIHTTWKFGFIASPRDKMELLINHIFIVYKCRASIPLLSRRL